MRSATDLDRTVKLDIDEGRAPTIEEAYDLASQRSLQIDVGEEVARSPTRQAILLNALNTGRRAFLGGVRVRIVSDPVLTAPWAYGERLSQVITRYDANRSTRSQKKFQPSALGATFGATWSSTQPGTAGLGAL